MGATGSRSSAPPSETLLLTISEYSKLLRVPGRTAWDLIFFRGLTWDVEVKAVAKEEGDVPADYLQLEVRSRNRESALGMDMSIEILDDTGEHTVFQRESSRGSWEQKHGYLMLLVRRNELEASSCVRRDDDSLTVRYTPKEQQQPKRRRRLLLGTWWPSSKSKKQPLPPAVSEVALAASHALTVRSLSELKAALLNDRWTYSTRFAVGGSSRRWFLALNPTRAAVHLIRATKDDDETWTRVEFSFALQGPVNVQSQKMRHTFDRANPYYKFEYQPPEDPSTPSTDNLVVWCYVAVIPAAAVEPTVVPPRIESLLVTPLLNAAG